MIYLVKACTDHEGSEIIGAFYLEADAKAVIDKCYAMDLETPEAPDAEAPDSEWYVYEDEKRDFDAKHPSPTHRDSYHIIAVHVQ